MPFVTKSKYKFPILIDFMILTITFCFIICAVFFTKSVIFNDQNSPVTLTVVTEPIDSEYKQLINKGDTLYDSITKRKLGIIEWISEDWIDDGRIRFIIKFKSKYIPKSKSLRSKDIWFYYESLEVTQHG